MPKKTTRDVPLPSSDKLFPPGTIVRGGKAITPMSRKKAQALRDAYEKQTGKKYKAARNTGAV